MSSPGDQNFSKQLAARLSHDLANVLLPLRAVADLPPEMRSQPQTLERLWVAADEAVVQLTRLSEELRSLCNDSAGRSEPSTTAEKRRDLQLPHCRVLVVEDQEVVRRAIVYLLHEAGQSCDVAATARAATERLLLDESFDLVLLDRNLPDMKAEQLAIQIHDRKPTLPLVLITGDDVGGGDSGVKWTSGEGHFTAMVAKPITLAQVRWLLAEIAGSKKNNGKDGHQRET